MHGSIDGEAHSDWSPIAHGKLNQAFTGDWGKVTELAVDVNVADIIAKWWERWISTLLQSHFFRYQYVIIGYFYLAQSN